jgi:hypothetical protein
MADEVKIVVILDTKDAKKKLKDFEKGTEQAAKRLDKKPKKRVASRSRKRSGGKGGGLGLASKGGIILALILGAISLINQIIIAVAAIQEALRSNESDKEVESLAQDLLDMKAEFLSKFTAILATTKTAKSFERVGLGLSVEQLKALNKRFAEQAKIQIQLADKEASLNQSDYLAALKRAGGFGGN